MITFESIVRHWCKIYKQMHDSPGNRKFFFTDSRENMIEMVKNWKPAVSPCVAMECVAEGSGSIERPSMNYPIYFFVRARKMNDGDEAWLAVKDALMHKDRFLAWLRDKHNRELNENLDGDYARINMDNVIQDVTTIGPIGDGWYGVLLQIDREEPLDLCVDPNLYEECCDC